MCKFRPIFLKISLIAQLSFFLLPASLPYLATFKLEIPLLVILFPDSSAITSDLLAASL